LRNQCATRTVYLTMKAFAAALFCALLVGCATPARSAAPTPPPSRTLSAAAPSVTAVVECGVTPFGLIPRNDVVAWDVPAWQLAAPGLWANPGMDVNDVAHSGFRGSDPGVKILWWTQPAVDLPVVLTIDSIPSGTYQDQVTFDPPGHDRQDRPTGFSMPPPGCYRVGIRLGTKEGSVIDRVLP